MKPPSKIILSFDPDRCTGDLKKIFEDKKAKILWCCIKYQHITSQHFNSEILKAANCLKHIDSSNYRAFIASIPTLVSQFGRVVNS